MVMYCDNESVVNTLTNGRSCDLFLQAKMTEVAYVQAIMQFELSSEDCRMVDSLSRLGNWCARRAFNQFACERLLQQAQLPDDMVTFTHRLFGDYLFESNV